MSAARTSLFLLTLTVGCADLDYESLCVREPTNEACPKNADAEPESALETAVDVDSEAIDTGADDDSASLDSAPSDTMTTDATDSVAMDSMAVDSTVVMDTTVVDTTMPDTTMADTMVVDTAMPDTAMPDTTVVDTAMPDTYVPPMDTAPPCVVTKTPYEDACVLRDDLGVFVSTGGNDANPGTKAAPKKTLGAAVAAAVGAGKRVYACAQPFDEALAINASVSIFGGLNCTSGWTAVAAKTIVRASSPALRITDATGQVVVEDFEVRSGDAAIPSGSSFAAWVANSSNVAFNRVILGAGRGAPGSNGSPGAAGTAGGMGSPGNTGAYCSTSDVAVGGGAGGAGAQLGGKGGTAKCSRDFDFFGNCGSSGGGAHSYPTFEPPYCGNACESVGTAVPAGCVGTPGASGMGGASAGTLSTAGYAAANGSNGSAGSSGGGGAGGNGGENVWPYSGGSGGGGGGGGAAGGPGLAGTGGGASVGLVTINSTIALSGCVLRPSDGGLGGSGGPGGTGGIGGGGGAGGAKSASGTDSAGQAGARGGDGGAGGNGGGGGGGPTIGIAHIGVVPSTAGCAFELGTAGGGGGPAAAPGATGVAANTRAF